MAKLYTSRYSNPALQDENIIKVGITLYPPRFPLKYKLAGNIMDIAPLKSQFNITEHDVFAPLYWEKMDKIGIEKIKDKLSKYLSDGKDVVLLCYEDVRKPCLNCHRRVFAEWWETKTGEKIDEYPDPTKDPRDKENKGSERNDRTGNNQVQMSLF